MTTNLLKNIDQAFRSRVDVHLLFNPLPPAAREVLWRKFLQRLPKSETSPPGELLPNGNANGKASTRGATSSVPLIDDAAYRSLSSWDLSGREIKNAVKTVRTWCACKGYIMDVARLEAGIRVTSPMARRQKNDAVSRQGFGTVDWSGEGGWGLNGDE